MEVFDVYKAKKLPDVYDELSVITMIDIETEAWYIASKDPFERVLVVHHIYGDAEAYVIVQFLDITLIGTYEDL